MDGDLALPLVASTGIQELHLTAWILLLKSTMKKEMQKIFSKALEKLKLLSKYCYTFSVAALIVLFLNWSKL